MIERVPLRYLPNEKPPYVYCESSLVGGVAPWHIRKVGPSGLKTGGGVDTRSLCEFIWPLDDVKDGKRGFGGWDLNVRITPQNLSHACVKCREAYEKLSKT